MRIVVVSVLAVLGLGLAACGRSAPTAIGDADRGHFVIGQAQCGSCHIIPGVIFADGLAGPPLRGLASRTMIAGVMANTPDNLVAWLRAPQAAVPGNAMPDMGLSEQQARDAAAYLETLR
ncbi:MAG TPA: c-type cytochrome [Caulobacteraceae bacterium]